MNKDVLSFTNIKVNHELLDKIWKLDPKLLDHIDGAELSSYALCLAQYLVYFTYQRNLSKAEQHRLTKYIDRTVSIILTTNNDNAEYKKFKTKAAAADFIISTNLELMDAQTKLEGIQRELTQVEGMDKVVSELIATIKRELTRRENELYQVRVERR
jgi:hypothetical protein